MTQHSIVGLVAGLHEELELARQFSRLTVLQDLAVRSVPGSGHRVVVVANPELDRSHLVLRQGPGLVGRNDIDGTQGFYGGHRLNDGLVLLGHLADPERQDHGSRGRQTFRNRTHQHGNYSQGQSRQGVDLKNETDDEDDHGGRDGDV